VFWSVSVTNEQAFLDFLAVLPTFKLYCTLDEAQFWRGLEIQLRGFIARTFAVHPSEEPPSAQYPYL
jgi:hypothetical protein